MIECGHSQNRCSTSPDHRPRIVARSPAYDKRCCPSPAATALETSASSARSPAASSRKTSDVDLLVDLPDDMSLLDLSGLKLDLEDALHRKVDVVPSHTIKPALASASSPKPALYDESEARSAGVP